jgi:hypothetical protein
MAYFPKMKLGKLEPKKDERTLKLSKYLLSSKLPALPTEYYYSRDITNWHMMANDVIGDCTCAASGHGIMDWTDSNGKLFTPTDADVIGAYSAVTGYVPGEPWTDNGAYCIEVLNYWRKHGIAGRKISAYTQINHRNSHEVEYSIYLFGFAYIGLALPLSAQSQPTLWSVGPNLEGDNAPGSWGGHCVIVTGFDKDGLDVITWGTRIRMTWNFWYCYVDEAYALLSPDFFTAGKAPNGFDLLTLGQDLSCL